MDWAYEEFTRLAETRLAQYSFKSIKLFEIELNKLKMNKGVALLLWLSCIITGWLMSVY